MNIFGKRSDLPFSRKCDRKKEKSVDSFTHEQVLFAAKQSWTTLRMSRPLFVGIYLQVTWWALPNEKEEKFAMNGRFPKVRTGRLDHGRTRHFGNKISFFQEVL